MAWHAGGRDASDRERTVLERAGINARKVGGARHCVRMIRWAPVGPILGYR